MKHEYAVFIGRFNPFHLGHSDILTKALSLAKKVVLVLGSHNRARNIKNPWSSDERKTMILSTLSQKDADRVSFIFLKDYLYNDTMWTIDLQNKIAEATDYSTDVALCGFKSDDSSWYLDLFPKWKYYSCPTSFESHAVNIREKVFTKDSAYKQMVHPNIALYIEEWMKGDEFKRLKNEFEFIAEYKERWRGSPHPPTFVTVDGITIKSGHILLVRRGKSHGKGLLALPGGFLDQDKKIEHAAVRELKEETSIALSHEELNKSITDSHIFDHPLRSLRGRTISHAFLINLGSGELPKVKGGDDADRAFWLPLNEVMQRESEFFEDHFYIIQYFVSRF